jgi:two-component system sensor histidine kinase/response regulator
MNVEQKSQGNILIIDDTAENLRLLTNILGNKGYEVRPVTSGEYGLQAAERSSPDLILLDINMPDMDGYEVCRRLKEHKSLREIPIIFITALTDTADKLKAFSTGCVDYVSKPFQTDEVLARVQVHVRLRRTQKELADNYEKLRESEKMRENLFNMIVHDMRSPLSVIMSSLELVRMYQGDNILPKASDRLDSASFGVRNLTGMTNDLLDISKMEEGKMMLKLAPCDLLALAAEIASGVSMLDRTRSITVDQSTPVKVSCDAAIMRRIFQNLLSNAIKHTPRGSAVQVTAVETENVVRVSVIDNGDGIPPEAREKIFEKFGAAAARDDGTYHSVGLGLAFCKLAVQTHGGKIGVDQRPEGGSIFWFELTR